MTTPTTTAHPTSVDQTRAPAPTTTRRPRRGSAARFSHYLGASIAGLVREWSFLVFIVTLPAIMYLFFAGIYGDQMTDAGVQAKAIMMVTMAAYGALGAAMTAGATIQSERSSGWFRQLMLTPLSATEFFAAKVLTAVAVIVPALATVFLAGIVMGVRMPLGIWFAAGGLLLVSLLPMVVLGLVIGLWFKQQTASAVTTLVMLSLSMIGGLWFPLDMMPAFLQTIGKLLPSYWAGRIGTWPLIGGAFPWQGVLVIGTWTVVLVALGALGYRRAVRTSRR